MALFGDWLQQLLGAQGQQPAMAGAGGGAMPPPQMQQPQPPQQQAQPPDALTMLQQFQQKQAQEPSGWQKVFGLIGGALKDYSAFSSGHPEAANFMTGYQNAIKQRTAGQLAQNAQGQVLGALADPAKANDALMLIARLQAMGVDTGPLSGYIANRKALEPKFDFKNDGEGNLLRIDEQGNATPIGTPKPMIVGPGQSVWQPGGGAQPQTAPQAPQGAAGPELESYITKAFPGARVTSGQRTAAQNLAVNGVPNSLHLSDNARDFVPPPGVTLEEAAAHFNSLGVPGLKAIVEGPGAKNSTGPHVHVQYAPPGSQPAPQGGKVLFQGGPAYRAPTPEELKQFPGASFMTPEGPKYPPAASVAANTPPDTSTIDYWAHSVAAGGPMPTLGMGAQAAGMRQAILKRAAEINTSQGLGGADQNVATASTKANSAALSKQTQLRSATEGFENTMLQNMNIARDLLKKGAGTTGVPIINRFQRYVKGEYAGDPDVIALNNAIDTVADENAKIRSGTLGNTPATDSMRANIKSGLNGAMTPQQIEGAFQIMEKDAGNRTRALRAQEDALRSALKGGSSKPKIPGINGDAATDSVVRVKSPADAAKLPKGSKFMTPDGRVLVRQ